MTLSKEQCESFNLAAAPLMQWLRENCHPHVTAIVDSERAECLEGLAAVRRSGIFERTSADWLSTLSVVAVPARDH